MAHILCVCVSSPISSIYLLSLPHPTPNTASLGVWNPQSPTAGGFLLPTLSQHTAAWQCHCFYPPIPNDAAHVMSAADCFEYHPWLSLAGKEGGHRQRRICESGSLFSPADTSRGGFWSVSLGSSVPLPANHNNSQQEGRPLTGSPVENVCQTYQDQDEQGKTVPSKNTNDARNTKPIACYPQLVLSTVLSSQHLKTWPPSPWVASYLVSP